MIILSNSIAQTVLPGQSLSFDTSILKTGCAECHRAGSGAVNLTAKNSIYEIKFTGNIGATAEGTAQLAISANGSPLDETTMISQTAAAGDLNNVGCDTALKTCCCNACESITVINTGTNELNIGSDPCLFIKRIA